MGLTVTFVSGERRCGKSALIRAMIDSLWKSPPHYIRLVTGRSGKQKPAAQNGTPKDPGDAGLASARWLEYDPVNVFDVIPSALAAIHREDRFGHVVIEADADPALRCAYSYDHRIFVMPVPSKIYEVFREPARAAEELHHALDDTAAFASEIFGLFDDDSVDNVDSPELRPEQEVPTMRSFLHSPLGDELATRIQLQPEYHGLVESEVIIVNEKVGERSPQTDECIHRIERLLDRLAGRDGKRGQLFFCDPYGRQGRDCKRLFSTLKTACDSVR